MPNIKLTLAYDGGGYSGWQRTDNAKKPCIQAVLEETLGRAVGEPVTVTASGRTDAGVHAFGQVVNFKCREKILCGDLNRDILFCQRVNEYLPETIRVLCAEQVSDRFHSRLDATSKIYEYHIDTRNPSNVFLRKYAHQEPAGLDIPAMKLAAGYLVGTHDFFAFCTPRKGEKSTVRTIYEFDIREESGKIVFSVRGNGFLYHMVRILSGTLIEVGRGTRPIESVPELLSGGSRAQAGWLAPANGLYLKEVFY